METGLSRLNMDFVAAGDNVKNWIFAKKMQKMEGCTGGLRMRSISSACLASSSHVSLLPPFYIINFNLIKLPADFQQKFLVKFFHRFDEFRLGIQGELVLPLVVMRVRQPVVLVPFGLHVGCSRWLG